MCKETNCVLYKNLHDSLYAMGKVHKWTYKENNKKYFLARMCSKASWEEHCIWIYISYEPKNFEKKVQRNTNLNMK